LDGIYLLRQLTEWPFVEAALLLIALTHISFDKKTILTLYKGRDQSSFRLQAQWWTNQWDFTGQKFIIKIEKDNTGH
jgi:hypothetical protein